MSSSLNLHRTFAGTSGTGGYIAALSVSDREEANLRSAREKIRQALRTGLAGWDQLIRKHELFEQRFLGAFDESLVLSPKFRMQGSFVYRTVNDPAQSPPQQIDLDDGVFLPISFLSDNGNTHPIVASRGFFIAVERILQPLCQRERWKLDNSKPSCVRVLISSRAHIDLALYAIPDEEFTVLLEKSARTMAFDARARYFDQPELPDLVYDQLVGDEIMLAHREEGWKPSDPRKIEHWFRVALETHGEQLRRVCRYLKGWRDHQWDSCCLASITLMQCAALAYDAFYEEMSPGRDDLALLGVADRLGSLFSTRIPNPVISDQRLDESWTSEERAEFVAAGQTLARCLRNAINETDDSNVALRCLRDAFGDRIPADTQLIRMRASSSAILGSGLLRQEATAVPPAVRKEGGGRYA